MDWIFWLRILIPVVLIILVAALGIWVVILPVVDWAIDIVHLLKRIADALDRAHPKPDAAQSEK